MRKFSIFNFQFSKLVAGITLFLFNFEMVRAQTFCPIGGTKVKVPCPLKVLGPAGASTFGGVALTILSVALAIVGSVAVAFLIYGGFRYITAYGNEEHAETGKKVMREAALGLVVVILAFAMISVITNILLGGRAGVF